MTNRTSVDAVIEVVTAYFDGLHTGDVEQLAEVFDSSASLQAHGLRLTRNEWLDRVASRDAPEALGFERGFEILSVDLAGDEAVVKAKVPLFGSVYVDFLSLINEDDRWKIVNKLYAEAGAV